MPKNVAKKQRSYMGIAFIAIIAIFLILIIFGMVRQASSADELKPGSSVHPHVFSYAPDDKTVWLGTHAGVYERKENKWLKSVPKLGSYDVMNLEIDPSNPNVIYTSGHGFIKKSEDGGKTWNPIENGIPNKPKPDTPDAHLMTMDPKNPNHLYVLLAGKGDNLFESKDGGQSWTKAGSITASAYSIAVVPDKPSSVLAATEQGLFRYDVANGAVKETKLNNDPAFQLLALSTGEVIAMQESGIVRSLDLQTWTPMKVETNGEMPLGIRASKQDPKRLVIVTQQLNVFESTDSGTSWTKK